MLSILFFSRHITMLFLQALMVGDDVVNDVGGAQQCGLAGVLVRTGKYQ